MCFYEIGNYTDAEHYALEIRANFFFYVQILCVSSWDFDERAAKPKFVAQSRPALYYSQQQVEHLR